MENDSQLKLIEETENFYCWLEYPEPRAKGQANIVPKEHVQKMTDLSNSEYSEMMDLLRRTVYRAENGLGSDGVTVAYHQNEIGGQMIPHVYIQIIPRYESDENAGTPVTAIFPKDEELKQNEEAVEQALNQYKSASPSFSEPVEKHPDAKKSAEKAEDNNVEEKQEEAETEEGPEDSTSSTSYTGGTFEWG